MSEEFVARVVRKDTRKSKAALTPGGRGYGFSPSEETTDSKPVPIMHRADAIWFAEREGYEVEWLDEEAKPA